MIVSKKMFELVSLAVDTLGDDGASENEQREALAFLGVFSRSYADDAPEPRDTEKRLPAALDLSKKKNDPANHIASEEEDEHVARAFAHSGDTMAAGIQAQLTAIRGHNGSAL